MKKTLVVVATIAASFELLNAQTPDAARIAQDLAQQIAQERRQAELEIPMLVEVLAFQPSMTVADVGAGGGAMTVVMAKWLRTGRVLATEINSKAVDEIREYAKRKGLTNVTVIEEFQHRLASRLVLRRHPDAHRLTPPHRA